MAWEEREGCYYYYYYRKVRVGQRVTSVYVGCGDRAEKEAREQNRRNTANERRLALSEERARIEKELRAVGHLVYGMVSSALWAAGLYQHKGQWRRPGSLPIV